MNQLYFKTSAEWRRWLENNHDKTSGVWLVFFKKKTGKPSIEYEAAVEDALSFGWIDSIIKNIDDQKYARKFTPRNEKSKWSELNKKRIEKLIKDKRITEFGLAKIETAKRNGTWDKPDRQKIELNIPAEFQLALAQNKKARENFNQLAVTYQKQYIGWIAVAKKQETRVKRIKEAIELLAKGEKLGLK
jgi:uncharacterized protein YdeI (YjbR/CyaY-like superfamily)